MPFMGVTKSAKEEDARTDAKRAADEGHNVFVFRFAMPSANWRSTRSLRGAAEVLEAIEGEGWVLTAQSLHPMPHGALVWTFHRNPQARRW